VVECLPIIPKALVQSLALQREKKQSHLNNFTTKPKKMMKSVKLKLHLINLAGLCSAEIKLLLLDCYLAGFPFLNLNLVLR
jgi:hypothetical protein